MCERELLTHQLFWLSQPFFPVLLGCSSGGLGPQPLLGHGSSIFSPTDLNFLSPGLYNNLTPTYFLRASQFALSSTLRQSRLSPDIFDRMHLLFTQAHFFFWQLGRSQYVTHWWSNKSIHSCWMLELRGMQSTPSLPSLPSPLWSRMVAPDRALSMGLIELNCILMLNWIIWNGTVSLNWIALNRNVFDD